MEDFEAEDSPEQAEHGKNMYSRVDKEVEMETEPFTMQEIAAVIKKMKLKKVPKWDAIEVPVVKKLCEMQENILHNIFNDCKTLGIFPKEWKKSVVVILIKAADKYISLPAS